MQARGAHATIFSRMLTQQFSTLVGTLCGALALCWAILRVRAGEGREIMIVFTMAQANVY